MTSFGTWLVVLVFVFVIVPLVVPKKPTGQHTNVILFLYEFLQFDELLEELLFLESIEGRNLSQLGIQEGLENRISVLQLFDAFDQGCLFCC